MSREIRFYKTHFIDFYVSQDTKVQEKIEYAFKLIRIVKHVPKNFLKHIENTNGLYEIRIKSKSDIYRIFCCFDKGRIVILFNVFQKKTQKTPKREIDKGIKLMNEYFNSRKGGKK